MTTRVVRRALLWSTNVATPIRRSPAVVSSLTTNITHQEFSTVASTAVATESALAGHIYAQSQPKPHELIMGVNNNINRNIINNQQDGLASFTSKTSSTTGNTSSSNTTSDVSSSTGGGTSSSSTSPPPLPPVDELVQDIHRAAKYNQGNPIQVKSKRRARRNYYWDVDFCRATANSYERYLLAMADNVILQKECEALLETSTVHYALGTLLKCHLKPTKLSAKVRVWERVLGTVLPIENLTNRLTLRMIEVNGKAGNIGRVLTLLEYRAQQKYPPHRAEFMHAITAVEVSGWSMRTNRNVYLNDARQPVMDDPTRWLDAILLNMSSRNYFGLDQELANRMLDTYSSRGRSGKAVHFFYSVHRTPLQQHHQQGEDNEEEWGDVKNEVGEISGLNDSSLPAGQPRPYKVRIKLKPPPPYHKIPSEVDGKYIFVKPKRSNDKNKSQQRGRSPSTEQQPKPRGMLKIDRENDPDWSLPLTAAFSFADSLTHGACGHPPIQLDLVSYNILIKTCVYRGALWRAMHLIDHVMPSAGVEPDHRSYDSLFSGLSWVGDVDLMRKYYQQMISKNNIQPSYYTVQCTVDGLLNLGDVAGAVTVIQDFFNQHNVLPPVETQLKVLEFALGLDMIYEAKRHVYFIQQLWKWQPHYKYESKKFIYLMKTYQKDPRISKEALQHLFLYFGEHLDDSDFF